MSAEIGHCCEAKQRIDWLLWSSLVLVVLLYGLAMILPDMLPQWLHVMAHTVHELMNRMWLGLLLGIMMVSVLARVPKEFVMAVLGTKQGSLGSLLRAAGAGVLLDLCSHGILMVGAKLYERGASAGQLMAFLLASPWNSFSLTLILVALIGLKWTLAFIVLSLVVAIVTGWFFDRLVARGILPKNPNEVQIVESFSFWRDAKRQFKAVNMNGAWWRETAVNGVHESRMVVRWLLFGVVLAAVLRVLLDVEDYGQWFGPTLWGLGATIVFATVLEVCSEGATPIAADIMQRADAPGNGFAFLMAGVATDYTEMMVIKDTTKSWKLALFLPLISVPQVLVVAWLLNGL